MTDTEPGSGSTDESYTKNETRTRPGERNTKSEKPTEARDRGGKTKTLRTQVIQSGFRLTYTLRQLQEEVNQLDFKRTGRRLGEESINNDDGGGELIKSETRIAEMVRQLIGKEKV